MNGRAELVQDRARAEEMWSALLKTWFPDGLETKGLAMIKVHAKSAEYWTRRAAWWSSCWDCTGRGSGDPDKFPGANEEIELT